MGDFQDNFQRLMLMPGGAAGFGMPGARNDQTFQDYLNERIQKDSQKRATDMQSRLVEDQMSSQEEQLRFNLLNDRKRRAGELGAGIASKIDSFIPSQMPNAMGGIPSHRIAKDFAPIPGTAVGNIDGMVTDFGKGVEAIKEAKDKGDGLMNPETRRMLKMLEGY